MEKEDSRLEIAEQIAEMIEQHGIEFTLPFSTMTGRPVNVATGKQYQGLNSLWLGLMGVRYCAGYGQWLEMGYQVQKGSKGIRITTPWFKKDDESGESFISGYGVKTVHPPANVRSIEDGSPWIPPELPTKDDTTLIAETEALVERSGIDVRYSESGGAYFSPAQNFVNMPHRCQFRATGTSSATECFESTRFHELTHATGHSSRLDRKICNKFGSADYAYEELVAELGAAMLCAEFGISPEPRADHSQYVGGWLKALDNDKKFILEAAKHSSKAVDYLLAV